MGKALSGKRALVTGGTKGIGKATALSLAKAGAHVTACYLADPEAAESTARELKEHGDEHQVVRADVTSPEDMTRLMSGIRDTAGGLDILVNNVGVDGVMAFEELNHEEWTRVMSHNVDAAYVVTYAALPLLTDGASIVNVGSSVALRGRARGVHYTTSKAGVIGFTRALSREVAEFGITVNAVTPGLTLSDTQVSSSSNNYLAATAAGPAGTLTRRAQWPAPRATPRWRCRDGRTRERLLGSAVPCRRRRG